MSNQVVYVALGKDQKEVARPTSNPEWVKIMVQTKPVPTAVNGVITLKKRVAFPVISKEVFEALNLKENSPLPGKIIEVKSHEPQYDGHEPMKNPTTGEEIMLDGLPVYRSTSFETDLNAQDKFLRPGVVEVEAEQESQSI